MKILALLIGLATLSPLSAFAPVQPVTNRPTGLSTLHAEPKKKSSLDPNVRTKLLTETIAPWRTVRLFFYGALGAGAAVGGFITLAGVLAALSGSRPDLDLNNEVYAHSDCSLLQITTLVNSLRHSTVQEPGD